MWNSDMAKERTEQFLREFERAVDEARAIVMQRDASGRNLLISPYEMFPNGPQDVLFLIHMKVGRAIGHQRAGRWDKADEEVADILNYAAFYKVVRRDWTWQATNRRIGEVPLGIPREEFEARMGVTPSSVPHQVIGGRPVFGYTRRTGPDEEDREPLDIDQMQQDGAQ